jgi:D-specific alpha-keto acid dehydrogenase
VNRLGITVYGCERDEAELFDELAPRHGIVPTITSAAVSATNATAAAGNRCVSVGHKSEISGTELRALRNAGVEHISTRSIGVDHIDVRSAAELGIAVEGVAYAPDGVADFTVMLILMAVRNAKDILRSAEQHDFRLGSVRGRDLRDMTVGVVGTGHIGSAVIRRLHGFGCRVLACDASPTAAAGLVTLGALLRESDVVTLHLPLNAETHHLIGRKQIEVMKQGAFLVNTARGALVDTAELIVALESGALAGVALDVLEGEEGIFYVDRTTRSVDNHLLLKLQAIPNAIVTPHIAYYTARTLHDTVEQTLLSCLTFEGNRAHEQAHDRDLVRGVLGGA